MPRTTARVARNESERILVFTKSSRSQAALPEDLANGLPTERSIHLPCAIVVAIEGFS